jgi:hypothetical protein
MGKSTSPVEIQDISKNGVWIIIKDTEYFLPYNDFPWFKNAKVSDIYNVIIMHGQHLYWPDLDIDLELDSLQNLEKYPLVYR